MKTHIFCTTILCSVFLAITWLHSWYPKKYQPEKLHSISSPPDQMAAEPFEILINEIQADPTPSVGLPEAEFIELYNHSTRVLELIDFKLRVSSRTLMLPYTLLEPGSYYIVCDSTYAGKFSAWGHVIPVPSMPLIPNAGSQISLINAQGITIHGVRYSTKWHQNTQKANGGWTLEMMDPAKACYSGLNWTSSANLTGGTPGVVNSWTGKVTPADSFRVITIIPSSHNRLDLIFNRSLLNITETPVSRFSINPGPRFFSRAFFEDDLNTTLTLIPNRPLDQGTLYSVELTHISDCLGDNPYNATSTFKLPEPASPGDVLINEILFNPLPDGKDYLELINISQKYFVISDFWLANTCSALDIEKLNLDYLFKPGDIIVISDDTRRLQQHYSVPDPYRLFENPLPAFSDHSGCAVLYTLMGNQRIIIDSFYYENGFHSPLLKDQEGVSLERVSIWQATNDPNNWYSAAHAAGYGTPGARNSQMKEVASSPGKFRIAPITFSPDGDGSDDFLQIHYLFDHPGFGLLVKIFDIRGRLIRSLVNGDWVSVSGAITWDGTNDDGFLAPAGVYTIWIKAYSESGHVEQSIKNCILARNF